jgi:hypothetical protein
LTMSFGSFGASQGSPLPSSQDGEIQIESEFQIHEEQSQQAVDKMVSASEASHVSSNCQQHAVTFSQNTSQLVPPLRPSLVKEVSQVSVSMSSLIDFENDRSSQDNDDLEMIGESVKEKTSEPAPKSEDELRREMLDEVGSIKVCVRED